MAVDRQSTIWAGMKAEWQVANQAAREAHGVNTQAFVKCQAGHGTGPTLAQLDYADHLQRVADAKRVLMDEFVQKTLGS